ncbi:MAG: SDR family NAD(P)-dependent oxidoreductase [Armatimonadetes bacterium]|nr:SDR family NAD(P)-dependent oxidoreductase [Armatimonadota bacterium]
MARATALGGISHLEGRNREFIERWEAEAYRKNVAKGQSARGRAAGKVALVTGSAQGIGLGIARDLVEQGAHVVMADINEYLCQTEAGLLCDEHGSGRAMGIPIDVTDAASVESAVALVVREFGGLDLVISNAGILRAGSVTEQSPEEFERVTKVNYLGYFHVVRAVAPVMAIQRRANPEWWGDIIQINSKSGLVGSNRNFAYAGSKFGGIGLTQSFALELVSLGIKVNAICPGNFFEGPLWSDPENGLFAQYLREGKAPGAKTVDDVRRFYEAKVPMGRGVTVADIMRAVYYLVEQEYETGQALRVTGGQVMLH